MVFKEKRIGGGQIMTEAHSRTLFYEFKQNVSRMLG